MPTTLRYSLVMLLMLSFSAWNAHARDIAIPAGTLMECTLSEPSFSSTTTSVGDPFLCYPRNIQEFGQPVFPRGSYLVGHLEDAKEPGHFVGKGYLRMAIDRIGLPTTDIPLRAKVIAVAGYKVDKEGKVIGHGHPTRDIVEWTLPPLWPWKILTLPARGPRPNLKGEVRVMLRVMDDFIVPQQVAQNDGPPRFVVPERPRLQPDKGWHRFGSPAMQRRSNPDPQPIAIALADSTATASMPVVGAEAQDVAGAMVQTASTSVSDWPANVTVFALSDGAIIPVQDYWRDGDSLGYTLASGEQGSVRLDRVDWSATSRLNWPRGIRVSLHGAPATGE
jgi:hypothetical protein